MAAVEVAAVTAAEAMAVSARMRPAGDARVRPSLWQSRMGGPDLGKGYPREVQMTYLYTSFAKHKLAGPLPNHELPTNLQE